MGTLTLTGLNPVTIPAGTTNPLEIYNIGTSGLIYVARFPGVTPTSAEYTIGPNGKVNFLPGVTAYICTDDGKTANVFYHSDGTAVDLGQVAINGPVSLAALPQLIETISIPTGTALIGASGYISPLDVSNYQSVIIRLRVDSFAGFPGLYDYIGGLIGFSDSANTVLSSTRAWQWSYGDTKASNFYFAYFQTPVRGNFLQGNFQFNRTFTTSMTINIDIYGVGSLLPEEYANATGEIAPSLAWYGYDYLSLNGAGTQQEVMSSISGPAYFGIGNVVGAGGQTMAVTVLFNGTQRALGTFAFTAPYTPVPIALPYFPLHVLGYGVSGGTADLFVTRVTK